MKFTKTQARECYDAFFMGMRALNGGTREENERQAVRCLELMEREAAKAAVIVRHPAKPLLNDSWLMNELSVTIPARVASFKVRYAHAINPPDNIVAFSLSA